MILSLNSKSDFIIPVRDHRFGEGLRAMYLTTLFVAVAKGASQVTKISMSFRQHLGRLVSVWALPL